MTDKMIKKTEVSASKAVVDEHVEMREASAPKPPKNRKIMALLTAAIAVLTAILVGSSIYNTPTNRLNRHLDMANKYLEATDYEQAVVEFDKVIEIDPMYADAYLGKAKAYVGLDNYDMAVDTLETGYLAIPEDAVMKAALTDIYMEIVEDSGEGKTYQEKLEIYDRLIELEGQNEDVLSGLEKCLEQYINVLLKEEKADEVRKLVDKYKDILAGTDFDTFLAQVEMRLREIGYSSLLSAMQELIVAENYDRANELVQTQDYQDMIASLQEGESYYYGERDQNGKRDGMGIAVVSGHYGAYYYYGSWSAGVKSGQGTAVSLTPEYTISPYGLYTGMWENDLPNGQGEERYQVIQSELEEDTGRYSLYRGFFRDGLYHGEIYIEVIWWDELRSYRGTAEDGVWKLLSDVEDGEAVILQCESEDSSGMWCDIEDNKDNGVAWLLPSSYWEESETD